MVKKNWEKKIIIILLKIDWGFVSNTKILKFFAGRTRTYSEASGNTMPAKEGDKDSVYISHPVP